MCSNAANVSSGPVECQAGSDIGTDRSTRKNVLGQAMDDPATALEMAANPDLYKEHGGIIDCLYHIVLLLFLEALWISLRIIIWHLAENLVKGNIEFSRTLCFVKSSAL